MAGNDTSSLRLSLWIARCNLPKNLTQRFSNLVCQSPKGLVRTDCWASLPKSVVQQLRMGVPRMCISDRFPGYANVVILKITHGEPGAGPVRYLKTRQTSVWCNLLSVLYIDIGI